MTRQGVVVGCVLAIAGGAVHGATGSTRIDSVEFSSPTNPGVTLSIKANAKRTQKRQLELGESWDGELLVKGEKLDGLRVTISYRNVMSLHEEGPHLDLFDWKYYEAEERPLAAIEGKPGRFTVDPSLFQEEAFPFVTRAELEEAVATHIRKNKKLFEQADEAIARWVAVAQTCTAPQVAPCGVGIGQVRFRFYGGDAKKPFKELVLEIPQGC